MQRKNNILKSSRSGMAMIMAITVIVIIATIMSLSIALTTQTTKKTTNLYLYEQAVLLSHSATEYALLKIAQSAPCKYTGGTFTQDSIYDINISLKYIYTNPSPCTTAQTYTTVQNTGSGNSNDQNGSVLMDVTVSVTDPTVVTEPVRYFRRTIQKL